MAESGAACTGVLAEFVRCLRRSPCMRVRGGGKEGGVAIGGCRHIGGAVHSAHPPFRQPQVEGKPASQCAGVVSECAELRATLFECKRRTADARSRIQGNKLDR